jgi:hypothetical protein
VLMFASLAPNAVTAQDMRGRPVPRREFTYDGITIGRLALKEQSGTAHVPEPGSTPVAPRGGFAPALPSSTPDDVLDGLLIPITRAPARDAGPTTPDAGTGPTDT